MNTPETAEWKTSRLIQLIWPLFIDQALIVLIGIVDTVMVATLGEAAVSGVSLVDQINILITSAISSLTLGGAVVCSQYLGRRDVENASNGARQLIYVSTAIAVFTGLLMFIWRMPIIKAIYGNLDQGVLNAAEAYFFYTTLSYPFIALSTAGTAVFRSMGNSRIGMWVSLLTIVIKYAGNALFIYIFNFGVTGVAIATLICRFIAAVFILVLLLKSRGPINITGIFRLRLMPGIIRSILRVAVPNGLEGGAFQVGKIALARLVTIFGTAAIAGNALGNIFMSIGNLPGMAIAQALLIVVGQCMGTSDHEGARRITKRLIGSAYIIMIVYNGIILFSMPLIFRIFGQSLSAESLAYGRLFATIFCTAVMVVWIPAYCLPFALRAAGDGPYTLVISAIAMWGARVGIAYLLAYAFGVGAVCVWISMVCEWVVRAAGYIIRWKGGKWRQQRVI